MPADGDGEVVKSVFVLDQIARTGRNRIEELIAGRGRTVSSGGRRAVKGVITG